MYNLNKTLIVVISILLTKVSSSQGSGHLNNDSAISSKIIHCPFDIIFDVAKMKNSNFSEKFSIHQKNIDFKTNQLKISSNSIKRNQNNTIPVVFHIVLNDRQISQMGGKLEIIDRIYSQLEVINNDFNGMNSDTSLIPSEFKNYFGNLNIKFGLAHTDPNGNYTEGFQFVSTSKNGFSVDYNSGTVGSKSFCSDAKYSISGGIDAWDTRKYLNIWVINISEIGAYGVGTPPPYDIYGGLDLLPWEEQGICIDYSTLGKKTKSNQFFVRYNNGRVLTHELGHFFNLFHLFGISTMQNNDCLDDDGVDDTPLQETFTLNTPNFPKMDKCSPNYPGIMFMNFMDYTPDSAIVMFSKGQALRTLVEREFNGFRNSLFNHPELLNNGLLNVDIKYSLNYSLAPNPTSGYFTLNFYDKLPTYIQIFNLQGKIIKEFFEIEKTMEINISNLEKGVYMIRCITSNSSFIKKIVLV